MKQGAPAVTGLVAATLEAFDEASLTASLRVGRDAIEASLDPVVEPAVLLTALRRGERVLAQREDDGWVVLGALRTAATPGVDEGDDFLIKARRVTVVAAHEFSVVSGMASFALRAYGHVEMLARDVTARASNIHKIVGRVIRLN
ncbi:hypothetical protein [Sorangium sp. So ce388]|uniref:hypothetical protein n=1 Tax=Sorangium sp. So ce388 TaxID=3133309 RepID=UPI003F5C21FE